MVVFAAALLGSASAQSAILFQQTLSPTNGSATFSGTLASVSGYRDHRTYISVGSGILSEVDWRIAAQFVRYWWELIDEDEFGNQEIILNGNTYPYDPSCDLRLDATSCQHVNLDGGLQNNAARLLYRAPTSYNNCIPFNGVFDVVCATLHYVDPPQFQIRVAGTSPITLTISDSHIAGAVPEPASWAMLIAGFGLVGAALRRKASVRVTPPDDDASRCKFGSGPILIAGR
nr:PEPxxWA-CTERM sorting domain-containing protein [Polymorphobacter fuscus]